MADLPTTLAFKTPTWMVERLRVLADHERRSVGNVIRVLLERALGDRDDTDTINPVKETTHAR